MNPEQFNQLKEEMRVYQRELMIANTLSKDSEVSGLHSQILSKVASIKDDVQEVKDKFDSHEEVINNLTTMLPEINEAIKAYRTTSTIGKVIVGIVVGVPALAAFVGAIIYFINLGEK